MSRRVWILGVFGGLALGAAAHAAESDDLNLVGTVPPILDIQVSPTAAANGLDLSLVQAAPESCRCADAIQYAWRLFGDGDVCQCGLW